MTKYTFLFGVLLTLLSNFLLSQSKFTIFSSEKLGKYDILHFIRDKDSVVIIKKSSLSNSKVENNIDDILLNKIGEKISKLTVSGKDYWFYFKIKSQHGLINSGAFASGKSKNLIYTYKNFPVLINQKDLNNYYKSK